jgi:hypothetical protein
LRFIAGASSLGQDEITGTPMTPAHIQDQTHPLPFK